VSFSDLLADGKVVGAGWLAISGCVATAVFTFFHIRYTSFIFHSEERNKFIRVSLPTIILIPPGILSVTIEQTRCGKRVHFGTLWEEDCGFRSTRFVSQPAALAKA
jgi:hypothetical protein